MEIVFKEFNEVFLELSWKWLNDPEIKSLTNTSDFTKEQQRNWFTSLSNLKNYYIWGVEVDSVPIGACGLKNCTKVGCESWMYIGEKQYWEKGIGNQIKLLIEEKAREIDKASIWTKINKGNTRSISLNKKHGYSIESETNSFVVMRKYL